MKIFSSPATLIVLLLIFVLAGLVGGPGNPFDVAVIHWLGGIRHSNPQFTSVTVVLTQLGSIYATLGLGLLATALLAICNRYRAAILLATTVIVERLTVDGLKLVIGRPRPDFDLLPVATSSSSFPSGHSANSVAVFVAVAMIAAPLAWRRPALAAAIFLSLVIGLTRIFLGVHWPSDVIGGWAWGLLAVALALAAGRRSGAIEAQHDVVGRHGSPVGKDEAA
jgi:undecaprenyl-diphosphatase